MHARGTIKALCSRRGRRHVRATLRRLCVIGEEEGTKEPLLRSFILQERKKAPKSHFKEILCCRRGRRHVRVTLRRSCVAGEEEGM